MVEIFEELDVDIEVSVKASMSIIAEASNY